LASAVRYLHVGAVIIAVSGAIAIYLNFQGARCLTDIARLDRSVVPPELVEEMERNCAVLTNSYVYCLYGVVTGIVLVVIGFMKKRRGNVS
jgi:hypothetical protein